MPDRSLRHEQFLAAATRLFGSLSPDALETLEPLARWQQILCGETLFRQGDPSDCLYVVVSGRLQVLREGGDGATGVVSEAGPGDSIGEAGFFTREPRTATVVAARDTLLVKFPADAFELVVARHPQVVRDLMRMLIRRMNRTSSTLPPPAKSVTVVPLRLRSPLAEFTARIATALGAPLRLSSAEIDRLLGEGTAALAPQDERSERLVDWLNQQESRHEVIVYETDPAPTEWTKRCLRQSDHILLVADASEDPGPVPIELFLGAQGSGPRRTLALLHPDGSRPPTGTRRWLEARRVDDHHHVRWDRSGDFARLARFLTGRAIGLALGGGGARGFAHIGILRALEEAGVPVDMVCGTSMGASLAAQHAMGWSPERIEQVNRRVWVELKPQKEFTLPVLSLLGNRGSTRCGQMMYGDVQIEDLWTSFFCVSSNLATASAMVHRSGSLLWAVTASASLPGVAIPVPQDGQLLCDGALLNNLPGDLLRQFGCSRVIAAEVSVAQDKMFECGRVPTVGEVVRNWLRRKRAPVPFPSLLEVLFRAAMLASIRREEEILRNADLVFQPPIDAFSLMDFERLHEIVQVGYDDARERLAAWRQSGAMERLTHG